MKITEKNNHATEALAQLFEQFIGKSNIEALLSSFLPEIQELEEVLYSLFDERILDTAVGAQLDVLGRLVQEPRRTDIDEDYRKYIKGRIAANRSQGKIGDLINIMDLISEDDAINWLQEKYPASVHPEPQDAILEDSIVSFDDVTFARASGDVLFMYPDQDGTETPTFIQIMADLLGDAKAAGLALHIIWSYRETTNRFQLSSQSGVIETSSSLGLANEVQSTGGYLSGVTPT